jgi:hypothetical protein
MDETFFVSLIGAVACGSAALLLWAVWLLRRSDELRRFWCLVAATAALPLLYVFLMVAASTFPDALDRLPDSQRSAVEAAVESSPGCGTPFSRVTHLAILGPTLHYSCGFTPFSLPAFDHEASCVEGVWRPPGWFGGGGSCTPEDLRNLS